MSGGFTWDAIVRVGTIKPYDRALVLTVYHALRGSRAGSSRCAWNTIVCFRESLRREITQHLGPGDPVHFQGYVRTSTFTDAAEAPRRAVDLVISRFDLLHKHIDGPSERHLSR